MIIRRLKLCINILYVIFVMPGPYWGTHLIFNYKGKNVLKKSDLAYKQEGDGTSHVYRLILKPDNTARVEVDGEKIYEGSLKEDGQRVALCYQNREIESERFSKLPTAIWMAVVHRIKQFVSSWGFTLSMAHWSGFREDWELLAPKEIKDPEDGIRFARPVRRFLNSIIFNPYQCHPKFMIVLVGRNSCIRPAANGCVNIYCSWFMMFWELDFPSGHCNCWFQEGNLHIFQFLV